VARICKRSIARPIGGHNNITDITKHKTPQELGGVFQGALKKKRGKATHLPTYFLCEIFENISVVLLRSKEVGGKKS
jgi:hypothetical protein